MQTAITGTPGAGKTLLAIAKLLLPLWDEKTGDWKPIESRNEDGSMRLVPRRVYTNIKGLQVEHELVDNGPEWEFAGGEWKQAGDHRQGLHNWHEWAKPGALLVVDEFQRVWPPRPNGAKTPPDVSAMDTHRHMGVDFILVTQNLMNVDRHITALIGRHLHVRRVANMALAVVYEWDHASRSLLYSKAISKGLWRYDKRVFKLYHSADLHTKQPRKIPALVYVIAIALAIAAWQIPQSYARIAGKSDQAKAHVGTAKTTRSAASVPVPAVVAPPAAAPGQVTASGPADQVAASRRWAGCILLRTRCECFAEDGGRVETDAKTCIDGAEHVNSVVVGPRAERNLLVALRPVAAASEPRVPVYVAPYSGPILPRTAPVSVLGGSGVSR